MYNYNFYTIMKYIYREEDNFREQEGELRGEDLKLQNSMIRFSQFLQDNEKKKNEAEAKKNEENKVTEIIYVK